MKKVNGLKAAAICIIALTLCSLQACVKPQPPDRPKNYSYDVATSWMDLNIRLTMITPGFNSVVSNRSFAYAGLTLYEATTDPVNVSKIFLVNGKSAVPNPFGKTFFWPASANAAMAVMTKSFFGNATAAGLAAIDSLEAVFNAQFQSQTGASQISQAVSYGKAVATAIFEWSKSDGAHECYLHITDPNYQLKTGPGKWVPTAPLFGAPVLPHWGDNRTFIPGIVAQTQPGAPIAYSEKIGSPFYDMVNDLYGISKTRTKEDSVIAFFWADIPGKLNVPAHATNILTQLIKSNKLDLQQASKIYAKHGMAMFDASVSCFKTKYQYSQLRPITYIRKVMLDTGWKSLIPTPPHPEYTAAHAAVSGASATILAHYFGGNYRFSDKTYESTLGARSYDSFDDYANEAGMSRLYGGIHYRPSIVRGIAQGKMVGQAMADFTISDLK